MDRTRRIRATFVGILSRFRRLELKFANSLTLRMKNFCIFALNSTLRIFWRFEFDFAKYSALWITKFSIFKRFDSAFWSFWAACVQLREFSHASNQDLCFSERFEPKMLEFLIESILRTFRALQFRTFKYPNALNARFFISWTLWIQTFRFPSVLKLELFNFQTFPIEVS